MIIVFLRSKIMLENSTLKITCKVTKLSGALLEHIFDLDVIQRIEALPKRALQRTQK